MSKFKAGDLVEVVKSPFYQEFLGERFTLEKFLGKSVGGQSGRIANAWMTPFFGNFGPILAFEDCIKKINPDNDKKSEYSFDDLINSIKSGVKDHE